MKFKSLIIICLLFVSFSFSQNVYLKITFNEGPLKGTHVFTPEKGNYTSQINLGFNKGISNINASKLVSESGIQIHYINKYFLGEATKGKHQAKTDTSGCGSLNFIDLQNNQSFHKIDGDFIDCSETTIKEVSAWETAIVKKRRTVSGSFSDKLEMKIRQDDGLETTINTTVNVVFKAIESRRK
ncbi:hypothetical protein [Pontimicrobium sp. MEBiC01747]